MIVDQKLNKLFVGVYLIDGCVDGTQLATTIKPTWFKKTMTRWLLGWKWITITELRGLQNKKKAEFAKQDEVKVVDIATKILTEV
jgi:hypothetical protein